METISTRRRIMSVPFGDDPLVCLESVVDPRVNRSKRHKLVDILVIALCGFLAGCEGWVDVELFGISKRKWLEKFLELPNGIPSHDTFGRVFALLDPQQLARVLRQFVHAVTGSLHGEAVAIDGKTLARSGESTTGTEALHLVSAWATQHGVVLGQVATADHSNEITAIPVLLQLLDVLWSSLKVTSSDQCNWFSIPQCPRISAASRSTCGGKLLIKSRNSLVFLPCSL